jgi:hypothetical protein
VHVYLAAIAAACNGLWHTFSDKVYAQHLDRCRCYLSDCCIAPFRSELRSHCMQNLCNVPNPLALRPACCRACMLHQLSRRRGHCCCLRLELFRRRGPKNWLSTCCSIHVHSFMAGAGGCIMVTNMIRTGLCRLRSTAQLSAIKQLSALH